MAGGRSLASRGNSESRLGPGLRRLVDRIVALENRRTVVIGSWRIRELDGELVAEQPSTGRSVTLTDGSANASDTTLVPAITTTKE